jgi:hypothetical protein
MSLQEDVVDSESEKRRDDRDASCRDQEDLHDLIVSSDDSFIDRRTLRVRSSGGLFRKIGNQLSRNLVLNRHPRDNV